MSNGFTITGCNAHCLANGCALSETLERIEEVAAFLDMLAHHMTRWPAVGNHRKEQRQAAVDCRAMAEKLRE